ncbi:MAG: hypothetical protein AAF958_14100 [Planctomycetota bacterium]
MLQIVMRFAQSFATIFLLLWTAASVTPEANGQVSQRPMEQRPMEQRPLESRPNVVAYLRSDDANLSAGGAMPGTATRWGVGMIEIPARGMWINQSPPPLSLADDDGRTLFPVADELRVDIRPPSEQPVPRPGSGRLLGRIRGLIREIAEPKQTPTQTVARRLLFLVRGEQPFNVTVRDAAGIVGRYEVRPRVDPNGYTELRDRWWNGYTEAAQLQMDAADYPTRVESYLLAMLSSRMDLPLPDGYLKPIMDPLTDQPDDALWGALQLIGGGEAIAAQTFRQVATGALAATGETAPLPPPPNWLPDRIPPIAPELDATITIEPIASAVPPECLYLRYGSFANFLWFEDFTNRSGGDLARLVTIRGIDEQASKRVQKQLHLETTELSRQLGPAVIDDQAMIGTDLFLGDGAAIGVLMRAKQPFLLRTSLNGDRRALADKDPEVSLVPVPELSKSATLLANGDGTIRSFMVQDKEYFLVTTSRHLAKRFLETRASGNSLATLPAFRYARLLMPIERDDSVFAYLSADFIRGLVSPSSMIELRRRLVSESEIALVHLARLAARQESGSAPLGIDSLRETGYLPQTFGQRIDGSGLLDVDGTTVLDSLRGRRGSMLPIADVSIDAVTLEEAAWYERIRQAYSTRFASIDPILIGLRRGPIENGIQTLEVHAEVAPMDVSKYANYTQYLGPPTTTAFRQAPDDLVSISAHIVAQQLGPPTHLFAAVKDTRVPEPEEFQGILNLYRSVKTIPGYLGAWPQPGALDRLPLGLGRGTPVGPNLSRLIGGLFRYSDGVFSLLSFYPDVIQLSLPYLEAIEVPTPAQIRVSAAELRGTQLEPWVNARLYELHREKSLAGANFLSMISRQFHAPDERALETVAQILGGRLQDPLGGRYVYDAASGSWISTAWNGSVPPRTPTPGYIAPPLVWFGGGTASLLLEDNRLILDATFGYRE